VTAKVSLVIFEGGRARRAVEQDMARVRQAVVLDTIEKAQTVPEISDVILVTNIHALAVEARAMGCIVETNRTAPGAFHFGEALRAVVDRYGLEAVITMGGAAAPLMRPEEMAWIARQLLREPAAVVVNNVQSPDIVGFRPASILHAIDLPASDNALGPILRQAGLPRFLIPNSAWINFDLDTPTDLGVLALAYGRGPRTTAAVAGVNVDLRPLLTAQELLRRPGSELMLIGRVGATIVTLLNSNFACRVRVWSEERGMKALGRLERGEVVSLVGLVIDRIGFDAFFADLARVAEAVLFDTRVLFAHWQVGLSDADRFYSDLRMPDRIRDEKIQAFTRAAVESPVPVVLGGHSLVYGGLWVLAESVLREQGKTTILPYTPNPAV